MGDVSLLFRPTPVSVGTIVFDATITETHSGSAEVTQHPVEKGANISDHVRAQPRPLDLVGVITNTPIVRASAEAEAWLGQHQARLEAALAARRTLGAFGPLGLLAPQPPELPPIPFSNENVGRAEAAWAELERILAAGELVTVVTDRREYKNMAIVSLSDTRDASSGDAIHVTIRLQEVVTVESLAAEVPPELLKKNRGRQATKNASAQQDAAAAEIVDNRTGAARLFDILGGK